MSRRTVAGATPVALMALLVAASVPLTDPGGVVLVTAYAVPASVLAVRRPGQPIAWLLLLMALGLLMGTTHVTATRAELETGTTDALGAFTAWANATGWLWVFAGFIGLAYVFPTGAAPGGAWRVAVRGTVLVFVPFAIVLAFGPVINVTLPELPFGANVPNPCALPFLAGARALEPYLPLLWGTLYVLTLLASASLLERFRRSVGLERLQYRWLAWALVLAGVAGVLWAVLTNILVVTWLAPLAALIVLLSYPAIPIAVVIAVLRYRLYEIDRLVSRTLGWGLATAAVVGVFVVAVLGLQAALTHVTQGQTLAVAASTLLAFAAFQPVRARVQALVDRRFDRPRLEAERSLAAYADRLQHEVDLPTLTRDIEATVETTLRPAAARLWIRGSTG